MKAILSAEEMYLCDRYTIDVLGVPSEVLMERAARAAAEVFLSEGFPTSEILILAGSGNNGGDGFCMARILKEAGYRVSVLYAGKSDGGLPVKEKMSPECLRQYLNWANAGGETATPQERAGILSCLKRATVLIDAMFGIGLDRPVAGLAGEILLSAGQTGLPVFAVDIPSGLSADSGLVKGTALKCRATATMAYLKRGLLLAEGAEYVGKVSVCDIGIGAEGLKKAGKDPAFFSLEASDLPRLLPPRFVRSNKGSYGRVLVVGGSYGMCGASYFAAKAAYRTGAGLVSVLAPEENRMILQTMLPEAVLSVYGSEGPDLEQIREEIRKADAVVVGCGLGQGGSAQDILRTVLKETAVPLVIDADALNLLAKDGSLWNLLCAPAILTPHPGEMARLCGVPVGDLLRAPAETAIAFAEKTGCVTVLKDAHTVTTDGKSLFLNTSGNNGMSTGGSGDVLAGILGGLLAGWQTAHAVKKPSLSEIAAAGVFLHGLSGDRAAEKVGVRPMLASDLLNGIADFLRDF